MRRVAPALALSVALAVSACGITSGPDQDPSPTAASGAPTWQPHTPSPQRTAASCRTVVVAAGDIVDDVEIADQTGRIAAAQEPDQVLLLGDNQYPSGALKAYQEEYDHTSWGRLKAITNPVPGNHEYRTRGAAGYFAYFNQPPPYYAYDAGCGWRAYALNSEIAVEPQVSWLRRDLAAHPDAAVLAYWHRPRWSSGTEHGSELDVQPFWTALAGRTGMVLNGHEHNYERFAPVGRIREFVAGTGGSTTYDFGAPAPGSQWRLAHTPGVLRLDLQPDAAYRWAFLDAAGATRDRGAE